MIREVLNIAGWSKMSTVDWPGEVVTTIFLQGCPFRCNYCHNFEILDPSIKGEVNWVDVLEHLRNRIGFLDGIVFSGGEPLMQANSEDGGVLSQTMLEAKKLGFKVGVHTSGAYPKRLIKILPLVDWVGFDIKAPSDLVDKITNREGSEKLTSESLEIILEQRKNRINSENPLDVQFRTTVDPTVISKSEVERLESELLEIGIDNLVLQEVRTIGAPKEYAEKLLKINQAKLSD